MKIAVTYDNGNVFQHFGRTEYFKFYTVEDNKVVSSVVTGTNGAGHGALAGFLAEQGASVVICGGLGGGALNALEQAGIEVIAGASGNTDEAVEAYLRGELVNSGANCDHHHHEEGHGCGSEGHGCHGHEEGSGCGSGCGGCHKSVIEGKNAGKKVKVHYKGTFNDGTQFDSSYDRGQPLEFVCGAGMMIRGFDQAVANMEVGEVTDVHLMPEEAYGHRRDEAVMTFEIASLPGCEGLKVGDRVVLRNDAGQSIPVRVTEKDETTIVLDANHEMAGKELNFRIELIEAE